MKNSCTGLSKVLLIAVIAFLSWILPSGAQAQTFPITIDPQGFLGSYIPYVSNPVTTVSGVQTYNLVPGTYNVDIGLTGSCSRKAFTVNGDGTVSNPTTNNSSGAFDFGGSTVQFKNSTVNFDGGLYGGQIWVHLANSTGSFKFKPPGSLVVVPDNVYRIKPDEVFSSVYFRVDSSGLVEPIPASFGGCSASNTVVNSNDALLFSGNTVQLKNTTVRFDPRQYPGGYVIGPTFFTTGRSRGITDVVLIPGFDGIVKTSSSNGLGYFLYKVNPDETVGLYNPPAPFLDSHNQIDFDNTSNPPAIRFKNVTVNFDPGTFQGSYFLDHATNPSGLALTGQTSHVLIPDTEYQGNIANAPIGFSVDASGNIQGTTFGSLTNLALVADIQGNTATFHNTRIFVAPNDTSTWHMSHITSSSGRTGSAEATVVPGAFYVMVDHDATVPGHTTTFNVLNPCSILPAGGVSIQSTFYSIVCVPMANAGADQTVNEEVVVSLNGTSSSFPSNGNPGYQWTQVAGPTVTLSDQTSTTPSFTSPTVSAALGSQILTFQLIVNDGGAFSDADTVDITVVHVNKKPVADAGDNFNLREGATGYLNSSHSYDPDGDPLSGHTWTQTAGPGLSLQPNGNTASPSFTAPLGNQTLLFQLQVSDGQLTSDLSSGTSAAAADTVQVTVGSNTAPVAHAGADQTVNESTQVPLDGTQSSDSDGDGLTYQWVQTGGSPIVPLSNPTSASPSFTAPLVGGSGATLTFSLLVTDNYAANPKASVADTVDVHVLNLNDPPRCDLAVPSLTSLWPPNHKMVEVTIGGVTDPNTDPVTITMTSVTQDEPVNGLGDGDTSSDAVLQTGSVLLRAERAGTGNGRVYVGHFTANDGEGSCNGTVTVGVPHDRKDTAIDSGQGYSSTTP